MAGAEVRARTPTTFSEALDGWRRAWMRWTPPEEARDRGREHLGFVRRV